MRVTIPTAPFDLGNGQHGIIVEPDRCDYCYDQGKATRHGPCGDGYAGIFPPPWVLDALEPCFLCEGRGRIQRTETDHRPMRCTDCHDGKPVVQFQVPCPQCAGAPPERSNCGICTNWETGEADRGLVSAGRWTVTEALPMLSMSDTPVIPCIQMADDGTAYLLPDVPGETLIQILPHIQEVTIPGDQADLIGKYLVIVEAVA